MIIVSLINVVKLVVLIGVAYVANKRIKLDDVSTLFNSIRNNLNL